MTELPDSGAPNAEQVTQAQSGQTRPLQTIGPYRLLQRVGEGGMGDVWLAEQTHPVRRQVALKIVKAGLDTAQVVARFEAERQALAVMDHPAIARVFDAGATPQGRPYFVMEYVRGEGITESEMAIGSACMRQNRFDEAERLFRSTLERQQRVLGDEDSLTINTINEMAVLYFRQGRYAEALPLHERGWHLHQKLFGENSPRTLISQGNLADTLGRLERYDEAEPLYRAAIAGQEHVLGLVHPTTQRTIAKLVAMYEAWGKPEKAAEWRAKLPKDPSAPAAAR